MLQEGDAPAAGGAEQESRSVLPGDFCKLDTPGGNQRLVGGHQMFPRAQYCRSVAESRLYAAHDLCRRAHLRVVHYGFDRRDLKGRIVLPRTDQHRAGLQPLRRLEHFIYAQTHRTVSQNRNFHICLRKFFVRDKKTLVF